MVGRNSRDIERALKRKGFALVPGHHRRYIHYIPQGPTGIKTYLSHGNMDYGDNLLASMSKQLHLSKTELLQFIDCTMSGAEYAVLMRERGFIG
jgi:predicted RNA binding protein YcfA (HicA-like mRNA interferase family)